MLTTGESAVVGIFSSFFYPGSFRFPKEYVGERKVILGRYEDGLMVRKLTMKKTYNRPKLQVRIAECGEM